jgi:predicted dehydrogenase
MHFALLGDHPDGLDFACAVARSGRHALAVYSGPSPGAEALRRWGVEFRRVGDLEEVLADPAITAVIVAGRPGDRAAQLRRALQSERHVVCVHPADQTPDAAYEAAMIQSDTKQVLLPLLPERLHPALPRLAEVAWGTEREAWSVEREAVTPDASRLTPHASRPTPHAPRPTLIEMERWSTEAVVLDAETPGQKPSLPGWDVLRALAGEIVEVTGFAAAEDIDPAEPVLLAGRFEEGVLFRVALLPNRPEPRWRIAVLTRYEQAELIFPQGWPGPARLTWRDARGTPQEESWETWNPWPALVEAFEQAVQMRPGGRVAVASRELAAVASEQITASPLPRPLPALRPRVPLTWQDAIRSLELDDAARRSVARRRASTLEYQEATEEAGFKGTMTLVGCSLLWGSLVLLILSRWQPWLGWIIAPLFGLFLLLQVLRWAVPNKQNKANSPP